MMKWMIDLQMHGIKEGEDFMLMGYINNITRLDDDWYIGRVNATKENILGHMVKLKARNMNQEKMDTVLLRNAIMHCTLEQRNSMCHVLLAHTIMLEKEVKQ